MIWAANDLWKTRGSRNIQRTGVHTVRMNFHLPVSRTNISWSGVQCTAIWFHIMANCRQSNFIQNIQCQKSTIACGMAKMSLVECMGLNFDVDRNYFWLEGYSRLSLIDRQFDTTRERYLQFRGEGCSWSLFILGMIKVQIIIFDSCKIRDYMKVFQNPHFGWPDNYWEGDHLFLNLLLAVLKVLGKKSTINNML